MKINFVLFYFFSVLCIAFILLRFAILLEVMFFIAGVIFGRDVVWDGFVFCSDAEYARYVECAENAGFAEFYIFGFIVVDRIPFLFCPLLSLFLFLDSTRALFDLHDDLEFEYFSNLLFSSVVPNWLRNIQLGWSLSLLLEGWVKFSCS